MDCDNIIMQVYTIDPLAICIQTTLKADYLNAHSMQISSMYITCERDEFKSLYT